MSRVPRLLLALLPLALLATACTGSSETTREVVLNVVTLQTGTTSDLRQRRGQGPFTTYEVDPATMLRVLEEAMEKGGARVEVYVSKRYGEVLAKEFDAPGGTYADPFRSAALAIVHPVRDREDASRVEVHTIHRGPFHRGRVAWAGRLPGWIAEALAARRTVRPIPPHR